MSRSRKPHCMDLLRNAGKALLRYRHPGRYQAIPFSQIRAGADILVASKDIDLRIEAFTLHPEDFDYPFFTLAREIEKCGIEV